MYQNFNLYHKSFFPKFFQGSAREAHSPKSRPDVHQSFRWDWVRNYFLKKLILQKIYFWNESEYCNLFWIQTSNFDSNIIIFHFSKQIFNFVNIKKIRIIINYYLIVDLLLLLFNCRFEDGQHVRLTPEERPHPEGREDPAVYEQNYFSIVIIQTKSLQLRST